MTEFLIWNIEISEKLNNKKITKTNFHSKSNLGLYSSFAKYV